MIIEIVCFIGRAGSGKDHQAKSYIERGYTKIAFADPLREMAWAVLGWRPKNPKEYDDFKKKNISLNPVTNALCGIKTKHSLTGRQFLENLGSTMRALDPNFWVNRWLDMVKKEMEKGNSVVCTDLRYINEWTAALNLKETSSIKFVFCNYISERYDANNSHESAVLSNYLCDLHYNDLQVLDYSDYALAYRSLDH